MSIKTYTYKGITIEAARITASMSKAERADLSKWMEKHNVTMVIETGYNIGTVILIETDEYSFHMNPGDWLAYDGDIFFHIPDKVFRKHYREVNDEEEPVAYATGVDMYQFIPPAWRTDKPTNGLTGIDKFPPIDGLISLDKLPPAYLAPGGWQECPRPRKRRGGTTMKAAYLDGEEIVTGGKVHQPFIDAIHKAWDKANAEADAEAFKQILADIERKQQAKETNQETYDRHLKLLDLDGHADNCTYCKDSTRNAVPPLYNKALADAVDQQLAGMANRRKYAHLHMDRDGKITPARHLREELERNWHPTDTTKTTPHQRADEWRPSLEVMAMYYNLFPPTVDTEKGDADHRTPGSGTIRLHNGITVTTKDGTLAYVHAKELTRLSNGDIEITGPRFTVGYTAEAYISFNYLNAYGAIRTVNSPAQGRKEAEDMEKKEREADEQGVFDAHRDNVRSCLDAISQLSDGNSAIQALVNQAENSLTRMHRTTPTTDPEDTND